MKGAKRTYAEPDYQGLQSDNPARPGMNVCYNCRHARIVPGSSHHQSCQHPCAQHAYALLTAMTVGMTDGWEEGFGISLADKETDEVLHQLRISGNSYAFNQGWFSWPFDFDPVWLVNCSGFEPRRKSDGA